MARYELLKERALANFELLLIKWCIHYKKIGAYEYDFLSPTRINDTNLGACRFNTNKGVGSDFAGTSSFSQQDFAKVGIGFTKEDFAGFTKQGEIRNSFDIIGLAQRIYGIDSYAEASKQLAVELNEIDGGKINKAQLLEKMIARDIEVQSRRGKTLAHIAKIWNYCTDINGTNGENYLKSRGAQGPYSEPNMKYHPRVFNTELNCYIPALIFKISKTHDGQMQGIHRIWIAKDGSRKAKLEDPKKAIGNVIGGGIWLGEPDDKLYVCEGPEEAINIRYTMKRKFVVSTVYATNYHTLYIPEYVTLVVLVHDTDKAGNVAAVKAMKEYKNQGKNIKIITKS